MITGTELAGAVMHVSSDSWWYAICVLKKPLWEESFIILMSAMGGRYRRHFYSCAITSYFILKNILYLKNYQSISITLKWKLSELKVQIAKKDHFPVLLCARKKLKRGIINTFAQHSFSLLDPASWRQSSVKNKTGSHFSCYQDGEMQR